MAITVETNNVPIMFRTVENMRVFESGLFNLIISHENIPIKNIINIDKKTIQPASEIGPQSGFLSLEHKFFISQEILEEGFDEEWCLQSIIDKKVYVLPSGDHSYMPFLPRYFSIDIKPSGLVPIEVEKENEETMLELLKNSYKYGLDTTSRKFVKLPNEEIKKNKTKFLISKMVSGGDGGEVVDKLNDVMKLLVYLLSKDKSLDISNSTVPNDLEVKILIDKFSKLINKTNYYKNKFENGDYEI